MVNVDLRKEVKDEKINNAKRMFSNAAAGVCGFDFQLWF
jgi:hypothetical protein